jgi:hypothetical protein
MADFHVLMCSLISTCPVVAFLAYNAFETASHIMSNGNKCIIIQVNICTTLKVPSDLQRMMCDLKLINFD